MLPIAPNPSSATLPGTQSAPTIAGNPTDGTGSANPFDMLLGMSLSLMDFENHLAQGSQPWADVEKTMQTDEPTQATLTQVVAGQIAIQPQATDNTGLAQPTENPELNTLATFEEDGRAKADDSTQEALVMAILPGFLLTPPTDQQATIQIPVAQNATAQQTSTTGAILATSADIETAPDQTLATQPKEPTAMAVQPESMLTQAMAAQMTVQPQSMEKEAPKTGAALENIAGVKGVNPPQKPTGIAVQPASTLTQAMAGQSAVQPQSITSPILKTDAAFINNAGAKVANQAMPTAPNATTPPVVPQGIWNIGELSQQLHQALNANQRLTDPLTKTTPQGMPSGAETASANLMGMNTDGIASPPVFDWAPTPVQEPTGNTRMPRMIEQVQQVADFLAERTQGAIKVGDGGVEANLRLYPPDLGGVRVSMNLQNGTMQAEFVAERPETAQLLQQHIQQFKDMVGRHGLNIDQVRISVSPTAAPAGSQFSQQDTSDFDQHARQQTQKNRQQNEQGEPHSDQQTPWDEPNA